MNDLSLLLFLHDSDVHPAVMVFFPLGCLFEQIAAQNKKMTRHEKQSETKQSKNKTLDVPVNIGVTLCQQRLNRSLLTEHPKWGKDINLLT